MILYAVDAAGKVWWYEHFRGADGKPNWLGPNDLGQQWTKVRWAFCGENGSVYVVQPGGRILWYDHVEQSLGGDSWDGPKPVATGWRKYAGAFTADGGVLYAVQSDGTLLWFKHLGDRDGSNSWSGPKAVGAGFQNFQSVFAGDDGAVYGVQADGTLKWYRHRGRMDGSFDWDGPNAVGAGWQNFRLIVPAVDGEIYAVQNDGTLLWYRHRGFRDGTSLWDGPEQVGTGWTFPFVFAARSLLEGYCWPLSAAPGETIQFHVSSPVDYQVTYVRFRRNGDQHDAIPMGDPVPQKAGVQPVPPDAWQNGCGWAPSFSLKVPDGWDSGIYAAECSRGDPNPFRIVFVVKPGANRRDFALLANTNTWNAYNHWGGRSKYTDPAAKQLSFLRPNPAAEPIDEGGINHLTRAELWVHDWLTTSGYKADVYSDLDFHRGIPNLAGYRALLLNTHPEYWTRTMLDAIQAYLAGGGRVVYLAGNGLFEEAVFSASGDALSFFTDGAAREQNFYRNIQPPRPERAILGVAFRFDGYASYGPFQVLEAAHPLFAGTGVANGALIGATGINGGGASGWEMDTSIPGTAADGTVVSATGSDDRGSPPAGLVLLARGSGPGGTDSGYGADITYYETPAGGFVFAAGSLSFGGSLVGDPVLQRLVRNVLDKCLP